jgi:hypothetical protein
MVERAIAQCLRENRLGGASRGRPPADRGCAALPQLRTPTTILDFRTGVRRRRPGRFARATVLDATPTASIIWALVSPTHRASGAV